MLIEIEDGKTTYFDILATLRFWRDEGRLAFYYPVYTREMERNGDKPKHNILILEVEK